MVFLPFLGHPDKPNVQGKNAATTVLKPLEFAQCLLTGSLLQGDFTEFFYRYILLFFLWKYLKYFYFYCKVAMLLSHPDHIP